MLAGKTITANLRKMDVAARYGGDEFVLLLPHAGSDEAMRVVQRIREEFHQGSTVLLRRNKGVTMSVGIGTLAGNMPGYADQLLTLADAALYRAKDSGRNQIMFPEACPMGDNPNHAQPMKR
jgi:diguanylate cyclase (GGDEF)-like protein